MLVVFTTGAAVWARGRWVDPVGDIGTWWSTTYRLANGELLYRDVYLQFGPLSPYLLAFGAKIFGASAAYLAVVSWIAAIAASLLLLRAARPFLTVLERVALVGLVLATSVFAPGPGRLVFAYAPAAVHALLLSFGALFLVRDGRARLETRSYIAGLLAGFAFCAKQEIGLACLVALFTPILLAPKRWGGWIWRVFLGFGVPVILGAVLALSSSSIESLRMESRLWPLAPTPPRSWLSLYRLVAGLSAGDWDTVVLQSLWQLLSFVGLCAVAGLLIARERRASRWLPTAILLLSLFISWALNGFRSVSGFHPIALSMLIAFTVAAAALVQRRLPERSSLVALGIFAGLVGVRTAVSTQLSGAYSGVAHFASAATWVAFLCVIAPGIVRGSDQAVVAMRRIAGIAILLLSWAWAFVAMKSLTTEGKERIATRQGAVYVGSTLGPFFRVLGHNLKSGEKIWVLPEINAVDALYRARSVSPYPSQMPGWLDESAEVELLKRIEANPPDAVVLFTRDTSDYRVDAFGEGYDRLLAAWIHRNYMPVETTRAGALYRRLPRIFRPPPPPSL
jgi:hypothetical protein